MWGAQGRACLAHVGVGRDALMAALRPSSANEAAITTERLGMSTVQWHIIAGEPVTLPTFAFEVTPGGGLAADPAQAGSVAVATVEGIATLQVRERKLAEFYGRPADTPPEALVEKLSNVRTLLDTAGMAYADLVAVLDTRFVNPDGATRIVASDPERPCDTTALRVQNLDGAMLDRFHRFVRLQRTLGWSAPDLDRAIHTLTPGMLAGDMLQPVAAVQDLAARLSLPLDRVLCFYAPLETNDYAAETEPPLYDRLFLNPTVITPEPGMPSPFTLNAARTELAVVGDLLSRPITAALLGVLAVTDEDLTELITGPRAVVSADHALNLANLSALVRTVTLAEALGLRVHDFLRLAEVSALNPFPTGAVTPEALANTTAFVEMVAKIGARGLGVAEIDAVLAATAPAQGGVLPDDGTLAGTLTGIRAALQAIYQQTARTTDEKGDLTRKHLALLGWDTALVEEAVATLLGKLAYTAPLPALPSGVVLPATMPVRYEPDAHVLSFTGPMTLDQLGALNALSSDGEFRAAVLALFDAPRVFVASRMKALRIPIFQASLAALPADFRMPQQVAGKVFFDVTEHALRARGYLSGTEAAALAAASTDPLFVQAVQQLRAAQDAPPTARNTFLTEADAAAMFDAVETTPADRFHLALTKLAPYLRHTLSEVTVKQQVGQATGLDPATIDLLLGRWLRTPTQPVALLDFLAPAFAGSDPSVQVSRRGFPTQFTTLSLVHRLAIVLSRLKITADQLSWVFDYAGSAGWLDLNALPGAPVTGPSVLFGPLLRLLDLARLRDTIPGRAQTLGAMFTLARTSGVTGAAVLDELSRRTGWNRADLDTLTGPDGLALTLLGDLGAEPAPLRVLACFDLLRRLGVSATRALAWVPGDLTAEAAQAAWLAAKARHSLQDWLTAAVPLQDGLRERKRAALVSYLTGNPLRDESDRPCWTDANGLHDHFLIDVEMSPCQQTTRIAQAVYTVQLFVQRCLLNLEPRVSTQSNAAWDEWDWMKQYRLWEANQKVFLYPENYLEPDLRADKSPFFTDLENELMQKEVTPDSVETAFRHYLHKLDEVARLQPCGMYNDYDPDRNTQTLYVFARTESTPRVYYHRKWVNRTAWTPWERINLDIEGETLMPMVWNRRLYLFWVSFTLQTPDPQPIRSLPDGRPENELKAPPKRWQIQLNWSQYVNGKWQAKRTTKDFLKPDNWLFDVDVRPFIFRPQYDPATGDLNIWCIHNKLDSPSEVFAGLFRLSSRRGTAMVEDFQWRKEPNIPRWVREPTNTATNNNEFVEEQPTDDKWLHLLDPATPSDNPEMIETLHRTPGVQPFRLLYPHQFRDTWRQAVMFFTDGSRSYLLEPRISQRGTLRGEVGARPDFHAEILTRLAMVEAPVWPLALAVPRPAGSVARPDGAVRRPVTARAAPASAPPGGTLLVPAGRRASQITQDTALLNPRAHTQVASLAIARISASRSALGNVVTRADDSITKIRFVPFYHPHVDEFIARLNRHGLHALFQRNLQIHPQPFGAFNFLLHYEPTASLLGPLPDEAVDFDPGGAYAEYNWELFFHAPLLLAERLSTNQRFADAQRWFHTIFDPTDRSGETSPQRFWRTKPFYLTAAADYQRQRIENILRRLATGDDPSLRPAVQQWLDNPFQPNVVARLRTTAYQKAVVMKYLDNLIAWGDQLFRQETLEAANNATQLYILAAELLGRRPDEVSGRVDPGPQSYRDLTANLQSFARAITAAENLIPAPTNVPPAGEILTASTTLPWLLYFCVPRNEKLLGYWDTVADRLFKVRHCLNIKGVERQLALFGAPIDPALLVRAAASGVDLSTVLDDIAAPLPAYRFTPMAAKASELAGELKAFGAALLAALEKRDAEALGRLRSGHEISLLDAARRVKEQQVTEAGDSLTALHKSRESAQQKLAYYSGRPFMNDRENAHNKLNKEAADYQDISADISKSANAVSVLPDFKIGSPTTTGVTWGSSNICAGLNGLAGFFGTIAATLNTQGSLASTLGGYQRRADDWDFQTAQAGTEIQQIDSQIAAATVRQAITQKELKNHDLQQSNARDADQFLRDKFTNQERYDWMIGQLSTAYFQAHQLAYDVAKRAERAYRHELGLDTSSFVQFGYWDSLHAGLLAGERLAADLKRMEASYLELNQRELELSKRVSLAQFDPAALLRLKETGRCYISLPESLFDLDCPGHYMRRIKTVTFTVPCVAGPYTGVNLTATLLRSTVRADPRLNSGKYARQPGDTRFRDHTTATESIVTSTGQEDGGLFETNLRDERYLPFEGFGAVSEWQLRLPQDFRQFDYETIVDVILHLRYTAHDGESALGQVVTAELRDALNGWVHAGGGKGLFRAFSARREYSDRWRRFLTSATGDFTLTFTLSKDRFPFLFRDHRITTRSPQLVLVLSQDLIPNGSKRYVDCYGDGQPLPATLITHNRQHTADLAADPSLAGLPRCTFEAVQAEVNGQEQTWTITIARDAVATLTPPLCTENKTLNPDAVLDLLLVSGYTLG